MSMLISGTRAPDNKDALLYSAKDEQEQISIRYRLRSEILKMLDEIDISPVMYEHEEVEPGAFLVRINKIRIKFKRPQSDRLLFQYIYDGH
jgi:hypothetical protein